MDQPPVLIFNHVHGKFHAGPPAYKTGTVTPAHLCPDLLRYEQIGVADNLRGRVVRAFFWLMRAWLT
jgi:hypothetical protein